MHVLITGAAGGLGRALAVECARRGYRLFLTDRNAQALCHIQDGLCRQFGVQVTAVPCDLTDSASVDAMLDQIDRAQMQFDMLLNVAGLDYEGAFLGCQRENIVQIVALNDAATLRITHAVLQRRSPGRRFFLVFVSSLASLFPMPLKATYAASKRFLLDFATALRQELKSQNVAVLALCPGGMATNEAVCNAIYAQGIWGSLTANPLEVVARRTLDRVLAGKSRYVPGVLNRFLIIVGRFLPRRCIAALVHWRWCKAQQKWLPVAPG